MRALWSSARSAGWRRLAPLCSSMARRGGPARRSPADSGIGRLEVRHCRLSCGFMPALRRIGRWGHVEGQAPRSSFFIGSIDAPDVPIGVRPVSSAGEAFSFVRGAQRYPWLIPGLWSLCRDPAVAASRPARRELRRTHRRRPRLPPRWYVSDDNWAARAKCHRET
jgi:hypothetical protein